MENTPMNQDQRDLEAARGELNGLLSLQATHPESRFASAIDLCEAKIARLEALEEDNKEKEPCIA